MKKISMLFCVFMLGAISATAFGGTVGVPATKVKVVHPRVVQTTVVAPIASNTIYLRIVVR